VNDGLDICGRKISQLYLHAYVSTKKELSEEVLFETDFSDLGDGK